MKSISLLRKQALATTHKINSKRGKEFALKIRSLLAKTVEMGGNKVLTGMVKRIDKDLQTITLDTLAEIEAFAKVL